MGVIKKILVNIFLICLVVILNYDVSEAMDVNLYYQKILENVDGRSEYDCDFNDYLIEKNASYFEYDGFLATIKELNRKEATYWWNEIEHGGIFFDELLFSHPKIKEIENEFKKHNKDMTIKALRIEIKKELIYDIENIEKYIQESISKYANMNKVFKNVFKRDPSEIESKWLSDIKTIKYAAYSGYLNHDLTQEEIELIDTDRGCVLIGEENNYMDAILTNLHRLQDIEVKYIRTIKSLKDIKYLIEGQFNLDIFRILSESEREDIYKKSILNYRFNKTLALIKTLEILMERGLIVEDEIEEIEPPKIENNVPSKNPYEERFEYLKKDASLKDFYKKLMMGFSDIFSGIKFNMSGRKEILFKVDNVEYKTGIFVDNNKINNLQYKNIIKEILNMLDGKVIYSKNKAMIQANKKIKVIDLENKIYNIKNVNESMSKLNITIYTK